MAVTYGPLTGQRWRCPVEDCGWSHRFEDAEGGGPVRVHIEGHSSIELAVALLPIGLAGDTLTPMQCWDAAKRENPYDDAAASQRYRELMVEHGHLVPRQEGDDPNLPCGWPGR